MKKFLLKIAVYILIILSILLFLNYRWVHTQAYAVVGESYRMKDVPCDIQICNVGSSHAQFAINYDKLEECTGFNFAVPAQSFMYDFNMLKQYENQLAPGCIVIIPISYWDYYEDYEKESIRVRERRFYYPILKCNLIERFDIIDAVKYKWLPVLTIKPNQLQYLIHDDMAAIANYEAQYQHNKFANGDGSINMSGFLGENDINVYGHSKDFDKGVNSYGVNRLKEMIEYCYDNDYKPLLITTPFTSYYNDANDFNHGFYDEFYSITARIADEYGLDYWDYSHDERFEEDLSLFYDNNHLNKGTGMDLFTSILIDRLRTEGYIN